MSGEVAPVCVVTDVDRVCLNSDANDQLLGRCAEEIFGDDFIKLVGHSTGQNPSDPAPKPVSAADMLIKLRSRGEGKRVADVIQKYADYTSPEQVVYEDVARYIESLRKLGFSSVLLTMGDEELQSAKLVVMQLGVPAIIADPTKVANAEVKAPQILSWRNKNGIYVPPSQGAIPASSAVLIDDKYKAFGYGLQPDISASVSNACIGGYWMNRSTEARSVPRTLELVKALPENLEYVSTLAEVEAGLSEKYGQAA